MPKFDAIIIGAGQAGPPLAGRLTAAGHKVAVIERKLFGGTCVNNGCIPTKTVIANAYAAQMARRAAFYGVNISGDITVDMKAVRARKQEVLMKSRTAVESGLRSNTNCTVYTGLAQFESPTTVRVGNDLLEAQQIFLNVGCRASVPPLPGLDQISYLTNTSILELDTLPRHLVIVGGSYIGIEFGQAYRRFGSQVSIVEMKPHLISHEDEDVSIAVEDILKAEGINIRTDAECIHFRHDPANPDEPHIVCTSCSTPPVDVNASHVLLAMGRIPNTSDLGLDKAGVEIDSHGYIKVDDQLRTNVPGIYAMGDCNGRGAFTHTSWNDFEIVAANLLDNEPRRLSDRITTYALYCDPPLGRIGMTEAQVRERVKKTGKPALIGTRPMTRVGRAVEKGESQGFMKVLVDVESKQILGASILGVGGDEAIHCIIDTMYAKAPYTTITHAVHIHPTVSELIPTVFEDLKPLT
jgi:pyruvate/2-oxoglutarate dehydrogenase complex dihydrolipoamide dehydrogenase (E3) component